MDKFFYEFDLDIQRQLLEQGFIVWIHEWKLLVSFPLVLEEGFNPELKFFWDILLSIELLDDSEEPREVLSILNVSIKGQIAVEDLDEVSHDVGEQSYSNQQNHRANCSLKVTSGSVVAKPNC